MGKPKLDPKDLEHNEKLFDTWSDTRKCPSCGNDKINIRTIGNHGANEQSCYYRNTKFFKFHCGKCSTSWHNKRLTHNQF